MILSYSHVAAGHYSRAGYCEIRHLYVLAGPSRYDISTNDIVRSSVVDFQIETAGYG